METEQQRREKADLLLAIHDNEQQIKQIRRSLDEFVREFEHIGEKVEKEKIGKSEINLDRYPTEENFTGLITTFRQCFIDRKRHNERGSQIGVQPVSRFD